MSLEVSKAGGMVSQTFARFAFLASLSISHWEALRLSDLPELTFQGVKLQLGTALRGRALCI